MIIKTCVVCGKEFKAKADKYVCCSLECRRKRPSKKKKRLCKYCGKEFTPNYKEIFCCRDCAKKHRKEHPFEYYIPSSKGHIPWNKGLNKHTSKKVKEYAEKQKDKVISKEIRNKISNKVKNLWKDKKYRQKTLNARDEKWQKRCIEIKRKNGTLTTSKQEKDIKILLEAKFPDIKYQYKSERYPFNCDFYIPELDLFIEYQGSWTHGFRPFDNSEINKKQLNKWKEKAKTSKFYKTAIDVWTRRDVLKRQTARNNNLNWLEFFSMKQFMDWYNILN